MTPGSDRTPYSDRGHVLAACDSEVVYCRIFGFGNMDNCAPFQEFAAGAQRGGCREFILDFSRCDGVDSTFLGVLLGISLARETEVCHVAAINVGPTVLRILSEVGIDRILDVVVGEVELPNIEMHRLEPLVGDLKRLERILKAHENLCRISDSNKEVFGSFVAMLRKELGRDAPATSAAGEVPTDSTESLAPFALLPIPLRRVWGGTRILDEIHPQLDADPPIGESWEVSDVGEDPYLHSVVADGGAAGKTLRQLIKDDPEGILGPALLGGEGDPKLPLLFKFIDARENLSVQVHPSDQDLRSSGLPGSAKSEAWVILDAAIDASVIYGFEEGWDLESVIKAEEAGKGGRGFRRVPVKRGDVIDLPAGTLHAIGAGVLLAEIQQSSDTTWRIHDWGRVGLDGRPRQLHLEEAAQVISPSTAPPCPLPEPPSWDSWVRRIGEGPFTLDELRFDSPDLPVPRNEGCFSILALLEGAGVLIFEGGSRPLSRGSVCFIPAGCSGVALRGPGETWALCMAATACSSH